jgi:hypothetical protein
MTIDMHRYPTTALVVTTAQREIVPQIGTAGLSPIHLTKIAGLIATRTTVNPLNECAHQAKVQTVPWNSHFLLLPLLGTPSPATGYYFWQG